MPEDTDDLVEWTLPDHEPMRRMILSRFEDDVLLREEVEAWLDNAVAPGEPVLCGCPEMGICYCRCNACTKCERWREILPTRKKRTQKNQRSQRSKRSKRRR